MKISLNDNCVSIREDAEYNLLLEMERKGLDVNIGCTIGLCGVCKIKVLKGKENLIRINEDIFELNDNEILPCCFKAKGDVSFEK